MKAKETSPNIYSLIDPMTNRLLAMNVRITQTPGPGTKDTTFTGSFTDPRSGNILEFISIVDA